MKAIRVADADFACLQEIRADSHRYLRRQLRQQYPHALFRDSSKGYGGLAFFSKYRVRDIEYRLPADGGWFPAWIVQADTPAGRVQVLNVHLRPRVADVGGRVVGHFTAGRIHRKEIDAFVARLNPGLPTIVAGDFNEEEGSPAMSFLNERGFTSAMQRTAYPGATWRGKVLGVRIGARVDHILFDPSFRCVNAQIAETGRSDHLPVIATLQRCDRPTSRPADEHAASSK